MLGSAPAAALAVRSGGERRSGNLYPALRRVRLDRGGARGSDRALPGRPRSWSGGPQDFFENTATILIWVDFWVGVGIANTLVGNVWDAVSPLSALGRLLERRLARDTAILAYSQRLGLWPAIALLLTWTWAELVWDEAKEPRTLALLALGYLGCQLAGMALFGTEVWLGEESSSPSWRAPTRALRPSSSSPRVARAVPGRMLQR